MSSSAEECDVVNCILLCEAKAILVVVSVHVVRINTITTLGHSKIQSLKHDVVDGRGSHIDPFLTGPAREIVTKIRGLKTAGVWAPVLVTATREVADDFRSLGMKSRDGAGISVEEINVPDVIVGVCVDSVDELHVPRQARLG